jgi:nitrogen fixation protein NifB
LSKRNRPEFPADTATFEGGPAMNAHHPCFNSHHAATARRIHLPVAKTCNIQCRFCNRLYDCVNESRPGVTSALLSPLQGLAYLERMVEILGDFDVAGIAGPGDAFADPESTIQTLRLVHGRFPSMALCVSSNGLTAGEFVNELAATGVTHVSVTVNAVDAAIGEKIIAWARFKSKLYRGKEAAELLLSRQLAAIAAFGKAGLIVKVNTIVIPTVNSGHIGNIAEAVAKAGANVHNCMPFMPVAGSDFEKLAPPDHDTMQKARWGASPFMPQVRHCQRCRADAAGILGKDDPNAGNLLGYFASLPLDPSHDRPYIAVASREGALVNEHVGRAKQFYIYRRVENTNRLVEVRTAPEPGSGTLQRWRNLAAVLHDCRALIASQSGEPPKAVLEDQGIAVIITEGLINEAVSTIYEGRTVPRPVNLQPCFGPASGHGCE